MLWKKADAGVVFLVKAAQAEQLLGPLSEQGAIAAVKALQHRLFFVQAMHMAAAGNHRLLRARQENARLQEKIAQVRLVSRAKCCPCGARAHDRSRGTPLHRKTGHGYPA